MDYIKIYNSIIEKRKLNPVLGYSERHHIIPKCMGGTDKKENIVRLTAEEHFVAHQLLVKIYPNVRGLIFALHRLSSSGVLSNKQYGWIKRKNSEAMRAQKLSRSREEIDATNAKMKETRSKWTDEYKEEIYRKTLLTAGYKPGRRGTEKAIKLELTNSERAKLQRQNETIEIKQERIRKQKETKSKRTEEQRRITNEKRAATFAKKSQEEIEESNRKRNETHKLLRLAKTVTTDDDTP